MSLHSKCTQDSAVHNCTKGPDPWKSQVNFGGNGDGNLLYPGTPATIGGTTQIPIESIRLKQIRDGEEDYEYLSLYEGLRGRAAALEAVSKVATNSWIFNEDGDNMQRVRRAVGRDITRIMRSRRHAPTKTDDAPTAETRAGVTFDDFRVFWNVGEEYVKGGVCAPVAGRFNVSLDSLGILPPNLT